MVTQNTWEVHKTTSTAVAKLTATVTAGHVVTACAPLYGDLAGWAVMTVGISFHIFACNPTLKIFVTTSEFRAGNVLMPGGMTLKTPLEFTFFTGNVNI